MKEFLICTCFLTWYLFLTIPSRAQKYEDHDQVFKKFEFEWTHRGTFNMSYCSKELINCWEFMRPDVQCSNYYIMESVCSVYRRYCNDVYGDMGDYGYNFEIMDDYCDFFYGNLEYTRRSSKWDRQHGSNETSEKREKPFKMADIMPGGAQSQEFRRRYFTSQTMFRRMYMFGRNGIVSI